MQQARYLILPFLLIAGGCASASGSKAETKPVVTKSAGLSEQNLEEGECAVFLWAASGKREFVYFQKQDSNTAKYYRDDTTMLVTTADATNNLADSPAINFAYTGQNGEKLIVTGGFSGEIEGGQKIAPATIKLETTDGWQKITPASGVFACL